MVREPAFHAHFSTPQNAPQLQFAVGLSIKLMTPQMLVANTVHLLALDLMVQMYHAIQLLCIFKVAHALLLL